MTTSKHTGSTPSIRASQHIQAEAHQPTNVIHHPAFGSTPVVNPKRRRGSKKGVVYLGKAKRCELLSRRERLAKPAETPQCHAQPPVMRLISQLIDMLSSVPGVALTKVECYCLEAAFVQAVAQIIDDRQGRGGAA